MKRLLYASASIALLSIAALAVYFALVTLPALQDNAERTTASISGAVWATQQDVHDALVRLGSTQKRVDSVLANAVKATAELEATIRESRQTVAETRQPMVDVLNQAVFTERELAETLNKLGAATKDAQDVADDLYPDVKALVANATVGSKSGAVVVQEAEKVAPQVASNTAAITGNIKKATSLPILIGKFLWDHTLGKIF